MINPAAMYAACNVAMCEALAANDEAQTTDTPSRWRAEAELWRTLARLAMLVVVTK